jgi:hypothetical protein
MVGRRESGWVGREEKVEKGDCESAPEPPSFFLADLLSDVPDRHFVYQARAGSADYF